MTSEIEEVVILMHSFDFQNISPQCQDKFRNVALILHDSGKTGDGRRVEYVFEIAADAEFMIDMTNNTRRQQGITAEFKKVVLPPKFSVTQIFLPYLCDPALPVRNLMPLTFPGLSFALLSRGLGEAASFWSVSQPAPCPRKFISGKTGRLRVTFIKPGLKTDRQSISK